MSKSYIIEHIEQINFRLAEIERRNRNRRRKGVISEVSDDKSKYRVKLSEQNGKPYITDWISARTLAAGGVKIDVIYGEGEQVDVISESGDLTDAQIDFSTYSDANARENSATPLHIKVSGLAHIVADKAIIEAGSVHLGGDGGKRVARIGDKVNVASGSSTGLWPIVEGSAAVFAVD